MSSVRAEFEAWRQRRLAELTEERDKLTGQREHLDARERAALSTGPAGEEVVRALEEFLQRNRCAEGTLEMTRIATEETEQFDSLVYGTGTNGQQPARELLPVPIRAVRHPRRDNYGDDFGFLNQTLNRKRLEEFVNT